MLLSVGLEVDEDLHQPLPFPVRIVVGGSVRIEGEMRGLEGSGDQGPGPGFGTGTSRNSITPGLVMTACFMVDSPAALRGLNGR